MLTGIDEQDKSHVKFSDLYVFLFSDCLQHQDKPRGLLTLKMAESVLVPFLGYRPYIRSVFEKWSKFLRGEDFAMRSKFYGNERIKMLAHSIFNLRFEENLNTYLWSIALKPNPSHLLFFETYCLNQLASGDLRLGFKERKTPDTSDFHFEIPVRKQKILVELRQAVAIGYIENLRNRLNIPQYWDYHGQRRVLIVEMLPRHFNDEGLKREISTFFQNNEEVEYIVCLTFDYKKLKSRHDWHKCVCVKGFLNLNIAMNFERIEIFSQLLDALEFKFRKEYAYEACEKIDIRRLDLLRDKYYPNWGKDLQEGKVKVWNDYRNIPRV